MITEPGRLPRRLCRVCRCTFPAILLLAFVPAAGSAQVLDDEASPAAAQERQRPIAMTVAGRVLNADGQPVRDARLAVVTSEYGRSARPIGVYLANALPLQTEVVGPVSTDNDGRFDVKVPASRSGVYVAVALYAEGQGHGFVTRTLEAAGDQQLELKLGPEHVIRGRLIDLKGQPAVGVQVRVVKRGWHPPPSKLTLWEPVTSDDKGRFLIRGLNSDEVTLQMEGEPLTPRQQQVSPTLVENDDMTTFALAPAKRLHGTVTFADTGKPVARAAMIAPASIVGDPRWIASRTDDDGGFSINPFAPDERFSFGRPMYFVNVFPPRDSQYVVSQVRLPASRKPHERIDILLERGVLLTGTVSEAASGEPIAGARVQYTARDRRYLAGSIEPSRLQTVVTDSDGRFALPVPPESGHLLVLGPTLDYIPEQTSSKELEGGKPGKQRLYADAVVPLDPASGAAERTVDITLRRGVTLQGRVSGPDGSPVPSFLLFSRSYLVTGYSLNSEPNLLRCRNGHFELPGCDPDKTHTVSLFDPKSRMGATAVLSREHEHEPAVIQLQPCGSATARFLDGARKPLAVYRPQFKYLLSEGAPRRPYVGDPEGLPLEADEGFPQLLAAGLYPDLVTDDDGRITYPALIPGTPYRLHWLPQDLTDSKPFPHVDFTVTPGETKDLGEMIVERRPQ